MAIRRMLEYVSLEPTMCPLGPQFLALFLTIQFLGGAAFGAPGCVIARETPAAHDEGSCHKAPETPRSESPSPDCADGLPTACAMACAGAALPGGEQAPGVVPVWEPLADGSVAADRPPLARAIDHVPIALS